MVNDKDERGGSGVLHYLQETKRICLDKWRTVFKI